MTTALRVENVSKQYRTYARPSDRLKESLTRGRWRRHQAFWALRDVSFELEKGMTVGIVGPNGCGKQRKSSDLLLPSTGKSRGNNAVGRTVSVLNGKRQ